MTRVTYYRQGGSFRAFEVSGHTGYAKAGEDIVCAALSAVSQMALIGLQEVMQLDVAAEIDDASGHLKVTLPREAPDGARLIVETLEKTVSSIDKAYPGYIRTTYREWRESHV